MKPIVSTGVMMCPGRGDAAGERLYHYRAVRVCGSAASRQGAVLPFD